MSALSHAFSLVFRDCPTLTVFRYSYARDLTFLDASVAADVDVSSTVGWFSTLCLVHVRVLRRDGYLDVLPRAVDTRQRIPARSWAYFASRLHHPDARPAPRATTRWS